MSHWPWPGDTITDQARRVALSYRQALHEAAPEACAVLDRKMLGWGMVWVAPRMTTVNEDEWVTLVVAADHTGLTPAAIYKWLSRDDRVVGRKGSDGRIRVRIGDVLAANAELRRERAARRT